MGAKAVIGIDAHDPKSYLETEKFEKAKGTLKKLGLELAEIEL